jgi:hypothetical protein
VYPYGANSRVSLHISTRPTRRNTLSKMISESQAQLPRLIKAKHNTKRVFSLHRYAAGKAELLVVACRGDCAILLYITA